MKGHQGHPDPQDPPDHLDHQETPSQDLKVQRLRELSACRSVLFHLLLHDFVVIDQ